MILTKDIYVPALRWRQAEYQALDRLSNLSKDRIVPIITIPDIEFDFEQGRLKKSVQDHVHPFSTLFKNKWGRRPAWIGIHSNIIGTPMSDGRAPLSYVFDELRAFGASAMPVITLDALPTIITSVQTILMNDSFGVAITIRLEDLMRPDARIRIEGLAQALGVNLNEIDLIIDIGAPNFEPYNAFAGALTVAINRLGDLQPFRNFVVIGTAMPKSFKDVAKGADQLPRHDWLFYQALVNRLPEGIRLPNFGDYTVVHPDFTLMDMRKINPAGKIVYTTSEVWETRKGGSFRDNPAQMHDHCASIVYSSVFKGEHYSFGDDYIAKCATKEAKTSNLGFWKQISINHHITHVLDDLATLFAAS